MAYVYGYEPKGYISAVKIKEMGITVAVGNPPYQDEGSSGGTNDAPIQKDRLRPLDGYPQE